jgi:DNA-binding NarL/FixJ family response regulator
MLPLGYVDPIARGGLMAIRKRLKTLGANASLAADSCCGTTFLAPTPIEVGMRLRVLLADNSQMVREAVRILLEREGLEVVCEAADGEEAVRLARDYHPDVAVLDLRMSGLNGLDAAREILNSCSETKVMLLTIHTEEYQVVTALRAGVRGYVGKSRAPEELVQAIQEVAQGGVYLSPRLPHIVAASLADGANSSEC